MSFTTQLSWRYATKKFDGTTIPKENIDKILEAIRFAPSSFGLQPFHVTVITDPKMKETLKALAWNQEQLTTASHVLVFSARTDIMDRINTYFNMISGGNKEIRDGMKGYEDMMINSAKGMDENSSKEWAAKQAYLALGFGLAACAELEIDSCPMEGFDKEEFKKALNLPENHYPQALLTIGKRASTEQVRPKVRFEEKDLFNLI